jgi:hypothetical protein
MGTTPSQQKINNLGSCTVVTNLKLCSHLIDSIRMSQNVTILYEDDLLAIVSANALVDAIGRFKDVESGPMDNLNNRSYDHLYICLTRKRPIDYNLNIESFVESSNVFFISMPFYEFVYELKICFMAWAPNSNELKDWERTWEDVLNADFRNFRHMDHRLLNNNLSVLGAATDKDKVYDKQMSKFLPEFYKAIDKRSCNLRVTLKTIEEKHAERQLIYTSFAGLTSGVECNEVSKRWFNQIVLKVKPNNQDLLFVCMWDGDNFKSGSFTHAISETLKLLRDRYKDAKFVMVSSTFANTEYGNVTNPKLSSMHDEFYAVTDSNENEPSGMIARKAMIAFMQSPVGDVIKTSCERLFGPDYLKWHAPTGEKGRTEFLTEYTTALNTGDWCKVAGYPAHGSSPEEYTKFEIDYQESLKPEAFIDPNEETMLNYKNIRFASDVHDDSDFDQHGNTSFGYFCLGVFNRVQQNLHVQACSKYTTNVGRLFTETERGTASTVIEYLTQGSAFNFRNGLHDKAESKVLKLQGTVTCMEIMTQRIFDFESAITPVPAMLIESLNQDAEECTRRCLEYIIAAKSREELITVILQGPPGCGKSTLRMAISAMFEDTIVCSADLHFMKDGVYTYDKKQTKNAHAESKKVFTNSKNKRNLIVVDNTSTAFWEFKHYIDASRKTILVNLAPDLQGIPVRWASNWLVQAYSQRNVHNVPRTVIIQMLNRLYDPKNSIESNAGIISLKLTNGHLMTDYMNKLKCKYMRQQRQLKRIATLHFPK